MCVKAICQLKCTAQVCVHVHECVCMCTCAQVCVCAQMRVYLLVCTEDAGAACPGHVMVTIIEAAGEPAEAGAGRLRFCPRAAVRSRGKWTQLSQGPGGERREPGNSSPPCCQGTFLLEDRSSGSLPQ